MRRFVPLLACTLVPAQGAAAQADVRPGADLVVAEVSGLTQRGHEGPLGAGRTAFSFETVACNVGTAVLPWVSTDATMPMGDEHSYIAFLLARVKAGRL